MSEYSTLGGTSGYTLSLLAAIDLLNVEAMPLVSPAHGSWLNMGEGFFSKLTKQMLNGIRVGVSRRQ